MASVGSIDKFIQAIAANGGMSMSNGYDVQFDMTGLEVVNVLKEFDLDPTKETNDSGQPGSLINMFCDEALLPNVTSATGQLNNRYQGEGTIHYPHTRMVSDFSLTWMCDANMAPYKFVTAWHDYIFTDTTFDESPDSLKEFKNITNRGGINRINRLKYPNQYQAKLRIAKTERGVNAPNSRVPVVILFEGVYPYTIDAVPLSYGSSQITKVTANFYYTRHTNFFADIRNFKG